MSNTEVQIFKFKETAEIRAFMEEGKPMFVANDIAKALGYKIPKDAVHRHCKSMILLKGVKAAPLTTSPRGIGIVPESDVYRLIMSSKLESSIPSKR